MSGLPSHRAFPGPIQQGRRLGAMLLAFLCGGFTAQSAVPFASGHGDGTPFLAPLLVLVALAYYLVRVLPKTLWKDSFNSKAEVPRFPSAPPRVR